MNKPTFFFYREMWGIEYRSRQCDIRFNSWLPLSVREGRNSDFGRVIRIPVLDWHIVIGTKR